MALPKGSASAASAIASLISLSHDAGVRGNGRFIFLTLYAVQMHLRRTTLSFCLTLLFANELYNGGQTGVELPLNNLSLDFLAKNRLTIRKFLLDVLNGHQHIRIFGAT